MLEELTQYLKEKYNPTAIILHGSRVHGMERLHSDWDFTLLFDNKKPRSGRELYKGENVEFETISLPVDDILDTFGTKLRKAQVLFEKEGIATKIIRDAEDIYSKGNFWDETRIEK